MKNQIYSVAVNLHRSVTNALEIFNIKQKLRNLNVKTCLLAKASTPLVVAILLNLVVHEAAHAQSNGPIFSGSANNLANIVREGLKLFAILLFCGGALGVGAAIWNKMWGKEWANYAIGGGAAFAFGTIIAVIYSIAQGQNVAVDTNF